MITIVNILYMSKPGLRFEHIKKSNNCRYPKRMCRQFCRIFSEWFFLAIVAITEKSENVSCKETTRCNLPPESNVCQDHPCIFVHHEGVFTDKKKTTYHCKANPFFVRLEHLWLHYICIYKICFYLI